MSNKPPVETERVAFGPRRLAELRSEFMRGQYWQFISIDEFIDAELRRADHPPGAPLPEGAPVKEPAK